MPRPKIFTPPKAGELHDWTLKTWPETIFPYDGKKARHLIRQNADALLRCGAVVRIGPTLVIFYDGWRRWLASNAGRVAGYDVAPNREEHAAKRFGGTDRE